MSNPLQVRVYLSRQTLFLLSDHTKTPLTDAVESRTPFCRFARSVIDEAITVMPLAPELLPRRDRRRQDGFAGVSVASVADLTPNVLGPLEGFTDIADMGYRVLAGVGFKEDRHSTWRVSLRNLDQPFYFLTNQRIQVRHPECKVFDGSPQDVFGDFASGKLVPPDLPPPGNPMIALVTGENTNFRLSQGNKVMPSVELFLSPLGIMDSATSSHFRPDFTALQMCPAVLHSSTIRRFSESILRLLEQGQTVRISLQSLQAHGIPQHRSILVIVGSRFPGLAHVSTKRHDPPAIAPGAVRSQSPRKIKAFIGDLASENPRATEGAGGAFVCSQGDGAGMPPRYIYNHGTGQHVPGEDAKAIDMDADTVALSCNSPQSLIHPGKSRERDPCSCIFPLSNSRSPEKSRHTPEATHQAQIYTPSCADLETSQSDETCSQCASLLGSRASRTTSSSTVRPSRSARTCSRHSRRPWRRRLPRPSTGSSCSRGRWNSETEVGMAGPTRGRGWGLVRTRPDGLVVGKCK